MKLTESLLRKIIKEELNKVLNEAVHNEAKMVPDGRGGFVEDETPQTHKPYKRGKLKFKPDGRGGGFYVDEKGNVVEPETAPRTGKWTSDGRGGEVQVSEPTRDMSKSDKVWMDDGRNSGYWAPKPVRKRR